MTLDCTLRKHAIKGHFCSLLISNIFCNPLFHRSADCFVWYNPETQNQIFFYKNINRFVCSSLLQAAIFAWPCFCRNFFGREVTDMKSILSVTPPWFWLKKYLLTKLPFYSWFCFTVFITFVLVPAHILTCAEEHCLYTISLCGGFIKFSLECTFLFCLP